MLKLFLLALISPALWSVSNYIDKYLVSKYFKGGGIGALMIFSSVFAVFLLPAIYLYQPSVIDVTWTAGGFIILSGVIWTLSVYAYLFAIQEGETSYVAPLFQTIPIFSFFFGTVFLHEILTTRQILGSVIVLLAAVALSLDLSNRLPRLRKRILFLMLLSSCLVSLGWLVFKVGALDTDYWTATFWTYVGSGVASVFFMLIPSYRKEFILVMRSNSVPIIGLNAFNEIITLLAGLNFMYIGLQIPLAILSTLNGFQPLFLFLYGIILTIFFPHIAKESLAKRHIAQKLIAIAVMIVGTYILST